MSHNGRKRLWSAKAFQVGGSFLVMNVSLILTLVGPDKPGLMQSIAEVVRENEGNWVESGLAHLANQFAGILRIEVARELVPSMIESLQRLESEGLILVIREQPFSPSRATDLVSLELLGQDHPGIVSHITKVFAEEGVNVEEFRSEVVVAPMSGETLFRASGQLRLAGPRSFDSLREKLERLAADLQVDLWWVQKNQSPQRFDTSAAEGE